MNARSRTAGNNASNSAAVSACRRALQRVHLTAIAMHSATEAALRKADLIDFIPDSEGKVMVRAFQGRRVVVDDSLPVRAGTTDGLVFTSYLFGNGAFAKGVAPLDGEPLQGGFGTAGVELVVDSAPPGEGGAGQSFCHPSAPR